MKFIDIEDHAGVGVVRLTRDVTNAINLELIMELTECLERTKENKKISGIVITSANSKFLSIGFDIPGLINLKREEFREFYCAFNRLCIALYVFPKPTVAAIVGHAVAGGCILTICCDYRYIAQGKKLMGLNEIKLGVPLPYPADLILRQIVNDHAARRILDTGDFFPPEDTVEMGLVDEVMPLERVVARACEKVQSIAGSSLDAYQMIKRNRTESIAEQITNKAQEKERIFIDLWYKDETRKKLEAALEKFVK
jgi:enoyl-CoA hydratase/carnithine racemase